MVRFPVFITGGCGSALEDSKAYSTFPYNGEAIDPLPPLFLFYPRMRVRNTFS